MKIATSIPTEAFLEAELLAKRLGLSKSELLRRALAAYIESCNSAAAGDCTDGDRVREAPDQIYPSTNSQVEGFLSQMQWASLSKVELVVRCGEIW